MLAHMTQHHNVTTSAFLALKFIWRYGTSEVLYGLWVDNVKFQELFTMPEKHFQLTFFIVTVNGL